MRPETQIQTDITTNDAALRTLLEIETPSEEQRVKLRELDAKGAELLVELQDSRLAERQRERLAPDAPAPLDAAALLAGNDPPVVGTRAHPEGEVTVTREWMGDMLATIARQHDAASDPFHEYRRAGTEAELKVTRALTNNNFYLQHAQRAANADLNIGTTTDALGGFLIPEDSRAYRLLQLRQKAFMGVQRLATLLNHQNDQDFPIPQLDRTGEAGESVEEGNAASQQSDFAATQSVLKSNRITSKYLLVPAAVLRSFAVEAEPLIMMLLAESVARRKAAQYATGTGVSPQAQGIMVGLDSYKTTLDVKFDISRGLWTTTSAANTGTRQDGALIPDDMLATLDSAYWGTGGSICMSPSFFIAMRQLTDSHGRYLFPELNVAPTAEGFYNWHGMKVCLDPNYTAFTPATAGTYAVATIGDHGGFFVRTIDGIRMSRNVWSHDLNDSVRFVIHAYTDSKVVHPWGLRKISVTVQA